MGVIFGLTQYMQAVLGYSPLATGIRFLPFAFGVALGANLSPRLAARFGTNRVIAGGFLGFAAIMAGAAFWQIDTSWELVRNVTTTKPMATNVKIAVLPSIRKI